MRATLALIRFELERRWLAFAGGLFGGLFVFLLPTIRGTATGPNDIRSLAVAVATATLVVVYSVALGGSLLANELAERRGSFLFGRPIGGAAIAAGRFVAALLVVVGSGALATLPSLLGGVRVEIPTLGDDLLEAPALAALLLAGTTALLLLSSAVLLSARARTPWIALELTALVGGGLLVARAFALLDEVGLPDAERQLLLGILVSTLVALAAIFAAAVMRGRTDLARAHGAQALIVVATLALTSAGAWIWASDYVSPTLSEVRSGDFGIEAIDERLLVVAGSEPRRDDLRSWFLLDGLGGRWLPAGQAARRSEWASKVEARGDSAFYFRRDDGQARLQTARLAGGELESSPTAILLERTPRLWAVSNDRGLLAVVRRLGAESGVLLDVHEIASGRLLRSTRLEEREPLDGQIEPEGDGFRLALRTGSGLLGWRIDRDGSARATARTALVTPDSTWRLDAGRARVFVRRMSEPVGWLVLDSESFEERAFLRSPLLDRPGAILSSLLVRFGDGSVATNVRTAELRELALFSDAGEPIRAFQWRREGTSTAVGAGEDHSILLATRAADSTATTAPNWTVERYDLETGERRVLARDVTPNSWLDISRPRRAIVADAQRRLFWLDPATGTRTPIAVTPAD